MQRTKRRYSMTLLQNIPRISKGQVLLPMQADLEDSTTATDNICFLRNNRSNILTCSPKLFTATVIVWWHGWEALRIYPITVPSYHTICFIKIHISRYFQHLYRDLWFIQYNSNILHLGLVYYFSFYLGRTNLKLCYFRNIKPLHKIKLFFVTTNFFLN